MDRRIPNTMTFSGADLEKMKREGRVSRGALDALKRVADEHLKCPVRATVYRRSKAPTGNPHDFSSIGPYWWPDPKSPTGLPYIRRDGEINPDFNDENDIRYVCDAVIDLSLAAYYFDSREYADRAVKFISDWFLSPETYMNPNLDYAQSIPGICDGRGIGIIDFRKLHDIFDGVSVLESLGYIDPEIVLALKDWMRRFTDWLVTSKNGREEACEPNNHGTYYDVLLLSLAIFIEKEDLARQVLTDAYERRFIAQIEPDGRQPLELARTAAMHYSITNINAFMLIANLAEHLGDKRFWAEDKKRGVSLIRSAVDYIYPFAQAPESFPYQELMLHTIPDMASRMLVFADAHFDGAGYRTEAEKLLAGEEPFWLARPYK